MYDPTISRFLQADVVVQAPPGQILSYDRYGYVWNNPKGYTDPSGYFCGCPADNGDIGASPVDDGTKDSTPNPARAKGDGNSNEGDANLNKEMGQEASGNGVVISPDAQEEFVVDSTKEAWDHYKNGNGETATLGPNAKNALRTDSTQQSKADKIKSGNSSSKKGNYKVDLTLKVFHVGRTRVDYVQTCSGSTCTTTFTGFSGDGFWDANVLTPWTHDGKGPGGEYSGGTVYDYSPYIWTEIYPNPY